MNDLHTHTDIATPGRTDKPARQDGPLAVALLLAALAGWVDATGFISSGGVFVSFMSGNTTHMAVSLTDHRGVNAETIAAIVALFVVGVAAGELLETRAGRYGSAFVLAVEALFLAAGALAHWLVPALMIGPERLALCPLAFAMGLQNATMHRPGGISVGLTYVTGTLVQAGRALVRASAKPSDPGFFTYLGVWFSLFAGAALGAVMLSMSAIFALLAAAALAVVLAIAMAVIRRQGN